MIRDDATDRVAEQREVLGASQVNAEKLSTALIGSAGVHFVVCELSLRGLIALPTTRNTAGVDVVVVSQDGSWHALLQVKTSKSKVSFWPVGTHYREWVGDNHYYAFIRYLRNEARFEAFLESASRVAEKVDTQVREDQRRGLKPWAPCWFLPKEEAERDRVHRRWLDFGSNRGGER
jgi:hypothetical protein